MPPPATMKPLLNAMRVSRRDVSGSGVCSVCFSSRYGDPSTASNTKTDATRFPLRVPPFVVAHTRRQFGTGDGGPMKGWEAGIRVGGGRAGWVVGCIFLRSISLVRLVGTRGGRC